MSKFEFIKELPIDAKQIPNTNNYVDKQGNIYSIYKGKLLKRTLLIDGAGYLIIGIDYIQADGTIIRKTRKVHRLVAEAFIPNPNNYPIIDHKNNDKTDDRVENLQWCTYKFNTRKAWDEGLCKGKLGKHASEEQKRKQSIAMLGKHQPKGIDNSRSIKIGLFDFYSDELIGVFYGWRDAEEKTGRSVKIGKPTKTRLGTYFKYI